MNIEILMLMYGAFGAYRGRKKEISIMLYRLIRNSVAMTTGAGLFRLIGNAASHLLGRYFSDSLGFFIACIVSISVLRLFKKTLSAFIDARIRSDSKLIGAVAGFAGNLILSSAVLVTFFLSHAENVQAFIVKHSMLMRMIKSVF